MKRPKRILVVEDDRPYLTKPLTSARLLDAIRASFQTSSASP